MYGMFIYMYSLNYPNEGKNRGKQTIHGVFGLMSLPFFLGFSQELQCQETWINICGCGWDGSCDLEATCAWLVTSLETFDDEIFFRDIQLMFFFFKIKLRL